jgi:hypothetical protein
MAKAIGVNFKDVTTEAITPCPAVAVFDPSRPDAGEGDPGDARIVNGDIDCGGSSRPGGIIRDMVVLLKASAFHAEACRGLRAIYPER